MNPRRWAWSGCKSSVLVALVGVPLVLCTIAAAWSGTAAKDAAKGGFTLRTIPASAVHHSWQPPRVRNKNGTSLNWSGYAVYPNAQSSPGKGKGKKSTPPPTFGDIRGSWVVPEVVASDSTNTYSSTWVGLDGYDTSTVEQIGTAQDWSNGAPEYYAWFEMYPKWAYEIVGFPVNPGDTISAAVENTAKGAFTLTIANESVLDDSGAPVTFSITQRSPSAQRLSAEWVEEAPWSGGVLPLADFGTVDFFDCWATMNGQEGAISDSQWQCDAITMETSDGTPKAVPSALSPDGTAFSVAWSHE